MSRRFKNWSESTEEPARKIEQKMIHVPRQISLVWCLVICVVSVLLLMFNFYNYYIFINLIAFFIGLPFATGGYFTKNLVLIPNNLGILGIEASLIASISFEIIRSIYEIF